MLFIIITKNSSDKSFTIIFMHSLVILLHKKRILKEKDIKITYITSDASHSHNSHNNEMINFRNSD